MPSKRGYSVHVRRVWKTYEIGLNWGELVLQGGGGGGKVFLIHRKLDLIHTKIHEKTQTR